MQALESLNDNQVNDFLSGKSPLNLSVRLGDHMMLIQLQLSTLSPAQQNSLKTKVANAAALKQQQQQAAANRSIINVDNSKISPQPSTSGCQKRSIEPEFDEMSPEKQRVKIESSSLHEDDIKSSPIKSLSSMVSSPLTTTVQNMNQSNNKFWADPIAANLTSCLCKRLNMSCNNNCGMPPDSMSMTQMDDEPCCSYSNPMPSPPRPIPFHQRPSTSILFQPKPTLLVPLPAPSPATPGRKYVPTPEPSAEQQLLNTDNPALAEASRNLTQTLRKLSKRVFTSKNSLLESTSSAPSTSSASSSRSATSNSSQSASVAGSSGAVIESMKHHGKGIYSGTFSGTLNPALQDKNGRPKRDISTIIHILNDLLSATPQCARSGAKIFFEPTQSSTGSTGKFVKVSAGGQPEGGLPSSETFLSPRPQVKKQSRTSCTRCVPTIVTQSQQKCAYGQCNGHSKTEMTAANTIGECLTRFSLCPSSHRSHSFPAASIPSTSGGITRHYCAGCNQSFINRKHEIENLKTKNKLDHLKIVMQQKKERREARKLQIAPYNALNGTHVSLPSTSPTSAILVPVMTASSSEMSGSLMTNVTNHLNDSADAGSSSSATATAIATSISSNNSEIENHLEEVDTVA